MSVFERILAFYKITDFEAQVLNYGHTFRQRFVGKMMSASELKFCLESGFYIGIPHRCHLGDFLSYTSLPYHFKRVWPECRVIVCRNTMSQGIFAHNPYVDAITRIKGRVPMGTGREFGFGNPSQRRLRIFGIFETSPVKPMLFTQTEWGEKYRKWKSRLPLFGRKLLLIQSSGKTVPKLFSFLKWWSLFKKLEQEFYVVQVGTLWDQLIPAHRYKVWGYGMQELQALMSQADVFLGPGSGPMHLAAGLDIPSVIVHNEVPSTDMYLPSLADFSLCLPGVVNHHVHHFYPWHYRLVMEKDSLSRCGGPCADVFSPGNLMTYLRMAADRKPFPVWEEIAPAFRRDPYRVFW